MQKHQEEYLAHYGIPGMKWGIRKSTRLANMKKMSTRDIQDRVKKLSSKRFKKRSIGSDVLTGVFGTLAASALAPMMGPLSGTLAYSIGTMSAASVTGKILYNKRKNKLIKELFDELDQREKKRG